MFEIAECEYADGYGWAITGTMSAHSCILEAHKAANRLNYEAETVKCYIVFEYQAGKEGDSYELSN